MKLGAIPLWLKWVLSVTIFAGLLVLLVVYVHGAGGNGPGSGDNPAAEARANRTGQIVTAQRSGAPPDGADEIAHASAGPGARDSGRHAYARRPPRRQRSRAARAMQPTRAPTAIPAAVPLPRAHGRLCLPVRRARRFANQRAGLVHGRQHGSRSGLTGAAQPRVPSLMAAAWRGILAI